MCPFCTWARHSIACCIAVDAVGESRRAGTKNAGGVVLHGHQRHGYALASCARGAGERGGAGSPSEHVRWEAPMRSASKASQRLQLYGKVFRTGELYFFRLEDIRHVDDNDFSACSDHSAWYMMWS